MTGSSRTPTYWAVAYFAIICALATLFTFASVRGDYGLFRRVQIDAETLVLQDKRDQLLREVAQMRNKTHRLSDEYLDLDLLDEQARDVLGLAHQNEIVIR